jgi:hypothetical protein
VTDKTAQAVLAGVVAALAVAMAATDLAALSGGSFWSDGATYHSMAHSLAEDFDLRYEARDVVRVRREFSAGPQGIFLKRASGGLRFDAAGGFPWFSRVPESEPRVYFAKAFTYPLAAAPFVRVLGTRGLLVLNALCLGLALFLGHLELRRRAAPLPALAATLAVFLGGIAPLYVLWPQPEAFSVGLVAAALFAWSRERPLLAAVLFGIATYTKPTNLLLAFPLGFGPLLARGAAALLPGLVEALRRGAVLGLTAGSLYAANVAVSGEANYQGGERKTFGGSSLKDGKFPFEAPGVTFGNSGFWMRAEHVGPLVEGEDEQLQKRGSGPLLAPEELRGAFLANLGYFWCGRYGGVIPYFFPLACAIAIFFLMGPREQAGWLAMGALVLSWLFYIWFIPANWYGGGGTVGNRYFVNLVPLAMFLVPRGREWLVAGLGALGALAFVAPIFAAPVAHSLQPGRHAMRAPFTYLPAELTMLNDLSFNTEAWRKRQPFGDTEGDPHRHWPPDPKSYWLYFPDDGTYGREVSGDDEGFWLKGGSTAEVLLRANEPVRRMTFRIRGGPAGDQVGLGVGRVRRTIALGPGEEVQLAVEPGRGLLFYDSFVYVLKMRSERGAQPRTGPSTGSATDPRSLGAWVRIQLDVDKRTRQASR